MSLTASKDTFIAAGGGAVTLHSGAGKVLTVIATTTQTSGVQTITLYDNIASSGPVLIKLRVPQTNCLNMDFAPNRALTFSTGLTIDPGDCDVHLTILTK
jgi:hypothetical protein